MNRDRNLPEGSAKAGYSALAESLKLPAPVRSWTAISTNRLNGDRMIDGWLILDNRVKLPNNEIEHLDFALRRESIDLLMLKKAFEAIGARDMEEYVRGKPTGVPQRKAWYLYEWLTGETLDVPVPPRMTSVEILDNDVYHAASKGVLSPRHRVVDNLPGTAAFCAIARRSDSLSSMTDAALSRRVANVMSSASADVTRRATAHLVLGESRSSFAIEGENPSADRLHRWGSTLANAGKTPLGQEMMDRLQAQVLGSNSMIKNGLRKEGVYLGTRDRHGDVVPEFIGARPEDLGSLMEGIYEYDRRMKDDKGMNPIVHAAGLAFGMVYVHPFEDGNGRIHRYLINHALTERDAVPGTTVLPVSKVILDRIEEYDDVLKAHSAPLMAHIPWRQNEKSNVVVEADTSDLYRYPDVTLQAEFLHSCVERTLEHDFPREISYIASYDKAKRAINSIVDMPGKRLDDFIMFVNQNENGAGTLPKKRRKKDFGSLDDETVARLEEVVRDAFEIDDPDDEPAPPTP